MSCVVPFLIRVSRIGFAGILGCVMLTLGLRAQEHVHPTDPAVVALQPLAQQVRRLETALAYLGQPLPAQDRETIDTAIARTDSAAAVSDIQKVLDRYVLANVHINPESRVKAEQGAAKPELPPAPGARPARRPPGARPRPHRGPAPALPARARRPRARGA